MPSATNTNANSVPMFVSSSTQPIGANAADTATSAPIGWVLELTNIGTLFAFVLVALGIVVLRRREPDRPRPFRTPWVPVLPLVSAAFCVYLMVNLPLLTWLRFGLWMAIGAAIYFLYAVRHSRVRRPGLDPRRTFTPRSSFAYCPAAC